MKFLKKFENFDIDQSTEIDEQDYLLNRKKSQYSPFGDDEDMEEEEENDVPEPNEEITLERKKSTKKEDKKPFFLKKKDKKEEKEEKTDSSKLSKSQKKLPLALQKAILARKK